MPPAAIIAGGAILGAGASVVAANKNKSAIQNSTNAQLQGNRESIAAQERANAAQLAYQREALDKGLAYQTNALNAGTALQTSLYNNSGQQQTDLYNQRQQTLQPWAAGGGAAFNQINGMLGLPQQTFTAPKQLAFTPVTAPVVAAPAPSAAVPTKTTPTPVAATAFNPTSYKTIEGLMLAPEYRALSSGERRDARLTFLGAQ